MERAVEAILFAASKPLRAAEIADMCAISADSVRRTIAKLQSEYDGRGSAIEIVKIGQRYSMQLRKELNLYSLPFAEKEMAPDVLKAAAIIAYNQPILQSDLAKMMGGGIYERVKILRQMGLISGKRTGQTMTLTTTRKFSEYFGIGSTRKEDIKEWMESKLK